MTMNSDGPAISDSELLERLERLLLNADPDTGTLDKDDFWVFATALAQGRGITDGLHAEGDKAAVAVNPSPATSFNDRQKRAYHIRLLVQLLLDVGGSGGPSILPGNFKDGAVVADLLTMLGGKAGTGSGKPQMLYSGKEGLEDMRRYARGAWVLAIHYRAARDGVSLESLHKGCLPGKTWRDWQQGVNRETITAAKEAGRQARKGGIPVPGFDYPDAELGQIFELARISKEQASL